MAARRNSPEYSPKEGVGCGSGSIWLLLREEEEVEEVEEEEVEEEEVEEEEVEEEEVEEEEVEEVVVLAVEVEVEEKGVRVWWRE